MIKCYFVEVKNITPNLPRSNFQELEIEKLADLILATDGLIRPIILKDTGGEKYTVIQGDLEYYAAVRAKEKNLLKAEEVNAFVVSPNLQQSATDQLALLAGDRSENTNIPTDISTKINLPVEQLLSTLSSAISPQLRPIIDRLDNHEHVLNILKAQPIDQTLDIILPQFQLILDKLAEHQKILNDIKSIINEPIKTKKPDIIKWIKQSADKAKLDSTLNLINTLSQDSLSSKMKQSGIANTAKLAANIIAKRNTQPEQKFDTWEMIVTPKISGLGDVTIKKIIDKLK